MNDNDTGQAPALMETDLPIYRTMAGHHHPVPFLLTDKMMQGLPFEVAGGEISDKVGKPIADPHTHDVPEIYLLLAPEPGAAVIDVEVDGAAYELSAPGALLIPAGAVHRFVTRKAVRGSYCLGILLTGTPATRAGSAL
jgi:hypothetical protein